MTALGAGTALSTLQAMGRPVIVMHGHKHYPTARLLTGLSSDQGDVMIVSAGSSGLAQTYVPSASRDAARLWPSFNVLELQGKEVQADVVSFGYRPETRGEVVVRPLLRARRSGQSWQASPVESSGRHGAGPQLERNELRCRLAQSVTSSRWDLVCERFYTGTARASPVTFLDTVDALEDGELVALDARGRPTGQRCNTPTDIRLVRDRVQHFRIEAGVCRTISESTRVFGSRWSPYSWMGLMNRYGSDHVRIELVNEVSGGLARAFASETDLGNGMARLMPLHPSSNAHRAIAEYRNCPPRTLLRIHWPLEPMR